VNVPSDQPLTTSPTQTRQNITFKSDQTPEIMSPSQVIAAGYASCTGLSIFLVNALRSVGIPARLAGAQMPFDALHPSPAHPYAPPATTLGDVKAPALCVRGVHHQPFRSLCLVASVHTANIW
jgi:hypothetical protein